MTIFYACRRFIEGCKNINCPGNITIALSGSAEAPRRTGPDFFLAIAQAAMHGPGKKENACEPAGIACVAASGPRSTQPDAFMTTMTRLISARSQVTACMLALLSSLGCGAKDHTNGVSRDAAALQKIVLLDIVPASATWEIFGTPEYSGGVPGPTDFVTLVAELAPDDAPEFAARPRAGQVWIARASARPWLSGPFHALLDRHENATVDLAAQPECRALGATLRKTGQAVSGFVCSNGATMLVYLTLADNTRA